MFSVFLAQPSTSPLHLYADQPRRLRRCHMQATLKGKRGEERDFIRVDVDLSSVNPRVPAHSGVTDNVSRHGVRILTGTPCQPDDRLNLRSLQGNFRSRARVVYCVPAGPGLWAVGLQLQACSGNWILPG